MRDFNVHEYLSNEEKVLRIRSHLRAVSWKKATKWAVDDIKALAEDMEIGGWVGFIESNGSILSAYHCMDTVWTKWRFNRAYKGRQTNFRHYGISLNNTIKNEEDEYIDVLVDSTFNTEEEAFTKQIYYKLKEAFKKKAEEATGRKITPLQVKQVKDLAKQCVSQRKIATLLGINRSSVRDILNGSSYSEENLANNTTTKRGLQMCLMLDMMLRNGEPIFTREDIKELKIDKDTITSKLNEIRAIYIKLTSGDVNEN